MIASLDIVIPVYNEGENIIPVVNSLAQNVATPFRILICYDHDEDNTLKALADYGAQSVSIKPVKNEGRGALGAILTGFRRSQAPAVLVMPADDDYNAGIIDRMAREAANGADVVCASRFMRGGCMQGCPWLKAFLVRSSAFALYHFARLPTRDPSNGFRLFSRRLLQAVPIEATAGFSYSIELLVKAHRLGWRIAEVPAAWHERKKGQSRFRVLQWLPAYLKWFFYAFETTWLGGKAKAVKLNVPATQA